MNYTGAMKNLFGLIPGLGKSRMHLHFADKAKFGTMLVDLALSIPRCFSFMDGMIDVLIVGIDGGFVARKTV